MHRKYGRPARRPYSFPALKPAADMESPKRTDPSKNERRTDDSRAPVLVFAIIGSLILASLIALIIRSGDIERMWRHLAERPSGALALRYILQPTVSSLLAIRDGVKDARTGRSPYFFTALTNPEKRRARLYEGLRATSKIIVLAVILDAAYQIITFKTFYPLEAVIVAILLGFIPHFLVRGPAERIAKMLQERKDGHSGS